VSKLGIYRLGLYLQPKSWHQTSPRRHGETNIGAKASSIHARVTIDGTASGGKIQECAETTMDSFGGEEDDRESGGSPEGSSDNEQDGPMDDRDDDDMDVNGEQDAEADVDGGGDNDEENEDDDDEQDQVDSQYSGQKLARASQASLQSNVSESMQVANGPAPTSHPIPDMLLTSPSPTQESTASTNLGVELPKLRPEVLTASVYDIVPTIAAPHSTSINSITATPDLRWVFTGGADGYIRKFNWLETANGKSMLTVAQRHPFVDSVTKAGVLMSYWENNEESSGNSPHQVLGIIH